MAQATATTGKGKSEDVESVIVVSYPKIIFLYPTLIFGLVTALYLSFAADPLDPHNKTAVVLNTLFLGVFGINLVVLAFDFPRTTSLTMFFCAAAIALGLVLLFTLKPELLPALTVFLMKFRPLANATYYWGLIGILGAIFAVSFLTLSFDYWEVRANEILHHHGFLSNLTRRAAPNLRLDNEINDLFEYILLRSGRLILQPSNERPIVLDNVPFIKHKERQIMNLLGALKVEIREDGEET
ncbi:MAG: hypothetical protein QM775_15325 [Pirellulales bacterium]